MAAKKKTSDSSYEPLIDLSDETAPDADSTRIVLEDLLVTDDQARRGIFTRALKYVNHLASERV